MAIKGKSKTKNRAKSVARAPRREPVVVKPPLFGRRWIQLTAAGVAGVLAALALVWVTNGLRQNDLDNATVDAASTRLTAAQTWQRDVTTVIGKVGTVQQGGIPPDVFAEMNAAIDMMKKDGTVPPKAVATFQDASDGARAAVDALTKFDVASTVADQGFNPIDALAFSDSRDRLVNALELYGTSADLAKLAAQAPEAQQPALVKVADVQRARADTEFQLAWNRYNEALVAGGISAGIPGAGGGSGLGG